MSYFHYILFYITDNPKWYILLGLILLIGTGYFLRQKAAKKSKKHSLQTAQYHASNSSSSLGNQYLKNYRPEINTAQSKQQSSFVVESVSPVFEGKTQGRSR